MEGNKEGFSLGAQQPPSMLPSKWGGVNLDVRQPPSMVPPTLGGSSSGVQQPLNMVPSGWGGLNLEVQQPPNMVPTTLGGLSSGVQQPPSMVPSKWGGLNLEALGGLSSGVQQPPNMVPSKWGGLNLGVQQSPSMVPTTLGGLNLGAQQAPSMVPTTLGGLNLGVQQAPSMVPTTLGGLNLGVQQPPSMVPTTLGGLSSGVTMKNDEGNQGFVLTPRAENPNSQTGPPSMEAIATPVIIGGTSSSDMKKRRGGPRKYGPEGVVGPPLSPMPISASIPLSGDFSGSKQPRARPSQTTKKAHKVEFERLGDGHFVGENFTSQVIIVNAGEDVAMKIISISQQESHAICVLFGSGAISNVTLRQPDSSGGTLTYEGRFEILSLSGSFIPTDNGIVKSRSGGISVSLLGLDGRVFGGVLAGLLVAASPVQLVLGSFLLGHHLKHKLEKQRAEPVTTVQPTIINQVQNGGGIGQTVNVASMNSSHSTQHGPMNGENNNNNNVSSPEEDSDDLDDNDSPMNLEISG